jgi:hypothetical protein
MIFENSWCKRLDIPGHYLLYLSLKKESGIPPTLVSSSTSNVLHKCCCIQYDTGWRPYTCNLKNSYEFSTREIGWTMQARVTIFCYFVKFLEKYDSSVLNVIFQQKLPFFCKSKKIDIREPLQQSTIWITQQFVWVNFLHLITKESSTATHPKDFL